MTKAGETKQEARPAATPRAGDAPVRPRQAGPPPLPASAVSAGVAERAAAAPRAAGAAARKPAAAGPPVRAANASGAGGSAPQAATITHQPAKGGAKGDIGLDIDVDFGPEPITERKPSKIAAAVETKAPAQPSPKAAPPPMPKAPPPPPPKGEPLPMLPLPTKAAAGDVVTLTDSEIVDEETPGQVPASTIPLLAALSVDLSSASMATPQKSKHLGDFVTAFTRPRFSMLPSSHPEKVAARFKTRMWVLGGLAGLAIAAGSWLLVRQQARPGAVSTAPTAKQSAPEKLRVADERAIVPAAPVAPAAKVVPAATAIPAVETLLPGESMPQDLAPKSTAPPPAAPTAAHVEAPRPAADPSEDARRASIAAPARRAPAPQAIAPISDPTPPIAAAAPRTEPPRETAPTSAFVDVDSAPLFDQAAAMQALREAGDAAKSCRSGDTPSGAVRVSVTFARTGRVAQANIEDAALASTPQGSCILGRFRAIQVPPFRGKQHDRAQDAVFLRPDAFGTRQV